MEALGAVAVITWIVGMLVAISIMRVRAGAGFWHGLKVFGPNGFGPGWVLMITVCGWAWPVTLVVWLARGRPEPRIVFNEKAVERQRRQAAAAAPAGPTPPRAATPAAPVARLTSGLPSPSPSSTSAPPTTSYGYTPPPDARVDGWQCPAPDCGRGGPETPARWPHPCPACGSATDPTFAEPWAHDARGPFLRRQVSRDDTPAREVWVGALAGWEHADALRSTDPAAAEASRHRARDVVGQVSEATAGSLQFGVVQRCLEHGLVDAAADEILFWSARVRTAGVEQDAGRRNDCRCLLACALDFLESPDGARNRWAPQIRHAATLLRAAVGGLVTPDVAAQAERVLGPSWAAPGTGPAPGVPARSVDTPPRPSVAVGPARTDRSADPDRLLAVALAGVVAATGPVLDAVRNWTPDQAPQEGALAQVRRRAAALTGAGPGSAGWHGFPAEQRAEWWVERIGLVVAAAVAAAASSGPLAERAAFRPAVSLAGQAFVLCAVAGEFDVTGRDELVHLLSAVLFERTPPADDVLADGAGALADVASGLDVTGRARVVALADVAWRIGSALLAVRSDLMDRPEPERRGGLGRVVPGWGAVGGFLDERSALRAVSRSGIDWIGARPGRSALSRWS